MKKTVPLLIVLLSAGMVSCSLFSKGSQHTTAVVRPKYHKTWPKNQWLIDIPIGARHIRLFERKRTHVVRMH